MVKFCEGRHLIQFNRTKSLASYAVQRMTDAYWKTLLIQNVVAHVVVAVRSNSSSDLFYHLHWQLVSISVPYLVSLFSYYTPRCLRSSNDCNVHFVAASQLVLQIVSGSFHVSAPTKVESRERRERIFGQCFILSLKLYTLTLHLVPQMGC